MKAILGLTKYEGRIITDLKPEQMAAHMQSNAYATTMPVKRIMETVLDTKIKENKELQELIAFLNLRNVCPNGIRCFRAGRNKNLPLLWL